MKIRDYVVLGWDQLRRRMVVTALCAMGIAIGSAAIIVALAFGESITHYAREQMNSFLKMDEITAFPGASVSQGSGTAGQGGDLTEQKIELIRQLPNVRSAALFRQVDYANFIVDDTKRGSLQLIGADVSKLEEFGFELGQGAFSDQDNAIVISYSALYDLYDTRLEGLQAAGSGDAAARDRRQERISYPLYQKQLTLSVYIGENDGAARFAEFPVRVAGVLQKPEGTEGYEGQKIGYVSLGLADRIERAKRDANGAGGTVQPYLIVKVEDPSRVGETEELIRKLNLTTQSNVRYQEETNSQFKIIRYIFGGAGLFILFVASISIIVAMTMSTYQRRRQIGIMKVLGANLAQIRNMFVVESALLGFIGGCVGILFSYWVIWAINIVLQRFAESDEILFIDPWILAVGLFFALLTGVLSGIYPAIKASRTDALTAIKRE
ncbi:ABC transporter permease [Cohnella algarum]|uniref:ABC transporter permease n=1 Tax=Cohnella algarum TaxID=2044859 RepID=UPI0019688E3A|nr:ABC transporter permease [Cohnella algarum]MBN2983383.1 ABC transporter permease [Cohnella algarum]